MTQSPENKEIISSSFEASRTGSIICNINLQLQCHAVRLKCIDSGDVSKQDPTKFKVYCMTKLTTSPKSSVKGSTVSCRLHAPLQSSVITFNLLSSSRLVEREYSV